MAEASQAEIAAKFAKAQDRLVLQASDLSLETIAAMAETGAIDLEPEYQRRSRWNESKRSALIESFLLNIPVPPVYLSEEDYGTYSVIDGKQRITAVADFMRDRLRLKSLEAFREVEGLTFSQLPKELDGALKVRPYIRAITLLKQSDPQLKYEVFSRLNSGGIELNPQEIRNVAYRGPLNELIYSLAEGSDFLRFQLKIKGAGSSAYREMADAEYVLRYFTLLETWAAFSGDYKQSMNEFMRRNRVADDDHILRLMQSFERAISACSGIWGEHAFHRPSSSGWRAQLLAGMYDAEMVAVSLISDDQLAVLTSKRSAVLGVTRSLMEDPQFETAVRTGTNTPSRVRYRISAMQSALQALT